MARKQLIRAMALAAACVLLRGMPARAATVSLSGLIPNICVLTLTTPGTLAISTDGTRLSSQESGGNAATLTVVAAGANPGIQFSAPSLNPPGGWSGSPTNQISYTSPGGANQAYTSGASTYSMNRLLDTLTIQGRVTSADGFIAGTYTLTSTATCQQ